VTASRPDRIWRTDDGRFVGDGHRDAAVLAAGPSDPVPAGYDPDTFEPGPSQPDAVIDEIDGDEKVGDSATAEKVEAKPAARPAGRARKG
jgi:hypothetical protein